MNKIHTTSQSVIELKALGSKETIYPKEPDQSILETFNWDTLDTLLIPFRCNEFTSICPKTGQPDFARFEIIYVPEKKCIESKSLKLYLFSFRNHGAFHESVTKRIEQDLMEVLEPLYLRIIGDFNVRGGISIKPMCLDWKADLSMGMKDYIDQLVEQWDRVKGNLSD